MSVAFEGPGGIAWPPDIREILPGGGILLGGGLGGDLGREVVQDGVGDRVVHGGLVVDGHVQVSRLVRSRTFRGWFGQASWVTPRRCDRGGRLRCRRRV